MALRHSQVPAQEILDELIVLAARLGARHVELDARGLRQRLAESRYYLAVVGQFKRGKSTLINALVDREVLPTGVTPVTTVLTVLRYGGAASLQIHFADGARRGVPLSELRGYVAEDSNPGNEKGVLLAEVFLPAPILAQGLCLVDTPGLGSIFPENTSVTNEFLPQIDAALVVLGADPPISGEELSIVRRLAADISTLMFVLNKADRVSAGDCREAVIFCQHALERVLGAKPVRIHEVSAIKSEETPRLGWGRLKKQLEMLATESGKTILNEARERGLRRILGGLAFAAREREKALKLSEEETSRRIWEIYNATIQIDQTLHTIPYGEGYFEARFAESLEEARQRFLREVVKRSAVPLARSSEGVNSSGRSRTVLMHEVSRWKQRAELEMAQRHRAVYESLLKRAQDVASVMLGHGDLSAADLPPPSISAAETVFKLSALGPDASLRTRLILFAMGVAPRTMPRVQELCRRLCLDRWTTSVAKEAALQFKATTEHHSRELVQYVRQVSEMARGALDYARQARADGSEALSTARNETVSINDRLSRLKQITEGKD